MAKRIVGANALGLTFGVLAVLGWAGSNVGAKWAVGASFSAFELTVLRHVVPAICLLPLLSRERRKAVLAIGPMRIAILALVGGPLYSLLAFGGLVFAPVTHGAVLGPAHIVLTTLALTWAIDGVRPGGQARVGYVMLIAGLSMFLIESLKATGAQSWMILGDVMFIASGLLFGVFSWLLNRWRIAPLDALIASAMPSAAALAFVALTFGPPLFQTVATGPLLLQILLQGAVSGFASFLLFASAVGRLGPARAGLFPAIVPVSVAVLAIPALGDWPTILQWTGVAVTSAGFVLTVTRSAATRNPP